MKISKKPLIFLLVALQILVSLPSMGAFADDSIIEEELEDEVMEESEEELEDEIDEENEEINNGGGDIDVIDNILTDDSLPVDEVDSYTLTVVDQYLNEDDTEESSNIRYESALSSGEEYYFEALDAEDYELLSDKVFEGVVTEDTTLEFVYRKIPSAINIVAYADMDVINDIAAQSVTTIQDSTGAEYDITNATLLDNYCATAYLFEDDKILLVTEFKQNVVMAENYPWYDEINDFQVRFTNDISVIGDSAFNNSGLIGSLVLPDSVTSIGSGAFSGCSFTGTLVIPDSVTSIGSGAFSGCTGFTGSLVIPDSVTSLGSSAFNGCTGFTGDLIIPNLITKIENSTFHGCTGFNGSLVIPNSVTRIGSYAFQECTGFTGDLIIPNSVTRIDEYTFQKCTGFTGNLVLSDSITMIGTGAFQECKGLTGNLVIPNSLKIIGSYVFSQCEGFTGNLVIPDSVTSIGANAFYFCAGFSDTLIIPDSVTTIYNSAFADCINIKTISIGSGLSSLPAAGISEQGFLTGAFCVTKDVVTTKIITENQYALSYDWNTDNRPPAEDNDDDKDTDNDTDDKDKDDKDKDDKDTDDKGTNGGNTDDGNIDDGNTGNDDIDSNNTDTENTESIAVAAVTETPAQAKAIEQPQQIEEPKTGDAYDFRLPVFFAIFDSVLAVVYFFFRKRFII